MELPKKNGNVLNLVRKEDLKLRKKEKTPESELYGLDELIQSKHEDEFDLQVGPTLDELQRESEHYGEEELTFTTTKDLGEIEEEDIGEVQLRTSVELIPKINPLSYDELSEDERDLLLDTDETLRVSDVILSNINKKRINEFLIEREHAEELVDAGLCPMNRILMYGALGTGKTMLTRALANEIGFNMLAVNIAHALDSGNAASNIQKIFDIAKRHPYCMIYLDECDSVAWNRSDDERGEDPAMRRALTSIFQQMDRMNDRNTVICASTNLLTNCDPAFERRWNMKMEFRRPKLSLKDDIRKFASKYKGFKIVDDVDKDFEKIIQNRTSMSYYELEMLVNNGLKRAVIDGTYHVSMNSIFKEIGVHMRVKYDLGTGKEDTSSYGSSLAGNDR